MGHAASHALWLGSLVRWAKKLCSAMDGVTNKFLSQGGARELAARPEGHSVVVTQANLYPKFPF